MESLPIIETEPFSVWEIGWKSSISHVGVAEIGSSVLAYLSLVDIIEAAHVFSIEGFNTLQNLKFCKDPVLNGNENDRKKN